jgi:hypothetical protein
MPWLKQLDLATMRAERCELVTGQDLVLKRQRRRPNPLGFRQVKGEIRLFYEDGEWRATPPEHSDPLTAGAPQFLADRIRQPAHLAHGATLNAGNCAYVYLEYPEARNLVLERAAACSSEEALVWADWLKRNHDPYAEPLRSMVSGATFGARDSWWLEGINRGMMGASGTFEMQNGFLRRVVLRGSPLPVDLHLIHVLTLRVAAVIEEITIDLNAYLAASSWLPFASSAFWSAAPWPATLHRVRLSAPDASEGIRITTQPCAAQIQKTLPHIKVDP